MSRSAAADFTMGGKTWNGPTEVTKQAKQLVGKYG